MNNVKLEEQGNILPGIELKEPNERIFLGSDCVSIRGEDGNEILDGIVDIFLNLLPRPSIQIQLKKREPITRIQTIQGINSFLLKLGKAKTEFRAFLLSTEYSAEGTLIVFCLNKEPLIGIGDEDTEAQKVLFHLFNFREIPGTRGSFEKRGNEHHRIDHISLCSDKWNVELRSIFETRETFNYLKSKGGYGITHVGCLTAQDLQPFNVNIALETLNNIGLFISFAKGAWCYPICAVGFDTISNRVWESWASPKEYWHRPRSWFDEKHCEQLVALFPKFMDICADKYWKKALQEIIYWYLISNNSSIGIDAGIILTQTAIERLSFEYTVRAHKVTSTSKFRENSASRNIRELLSSLGIPAGIPSEVPRLNKLAKEFKWEDSADALTDVRNSLVHPDNKKKGSFSDCYYETWNLGLWYLELAILRICKYSEVYANRLSQERVGQVEKLPWLSETNSSDRDKT